jgi:general secretion pathway protein N
MSRQRLIFAFVVLLAIALVATLPMRLVLPDGPISARAVEGSIWSAQLDDVGVGGVPLGKMRAGYRPLARVWVANDTGLTAELGLGGSIEKLNGSVAVAGALPPFPADVLEFRQVSLAMGDQGCTKADGRIRLILGQTGGGLPPGETLVGPLRCNAGQLSARLASQSGLDVLDFRVGADQRYRATLTVRPASAEAASALTAAGFKQAPTGYQLAITGAL